VSRLLKLYDKMTMVDVVRPGTYLIVDGAKPHDTVWWELSEAVEIQAEYEWAGERGWRRVHGGNGQGHPRLTVGAVEYASARPLLTSWGAFVRWFTGRDPRDTRPAVLELPVARLLERGR